MLQRMDLVEETRFSSLLPFKFIYSPLVFNRVVAEEHQYVLSFLVEKDETISLNCNTIQSEMLNVCLICAVILTVFLTNIHLAYAISLDIGCS